MIISLIMNFEALWWLRLILNNESLIKNIWYLIISREDSQKIQKIGLWPVAVLKLLLIAVASSMIYSVWSQSQTYIYAVSHLLVRISLLEFLHSLSFLKLSAQDEIVEKTFGTFSIWWSLDNRFKIKSNDHLRCR